MGIERDFLVVHLAQMQRQRDGAIATLGRVEGAIAAYQQMLAEHDASEAAAQVKAASDATRPPAPVGAARPDWDNARYARDDDPRGSNYRVASPLGQE